MAPGDQTHFDFVDETMGVYRPNAYFGGMGCGRHRKRRGEEEMLSTPMSSRGRLYTLCGWWAMARPV